MRKIIFYSLLCLFGLGIYGAMRGSSPSSQPAPPAAVAEVERQVPPTSSSQASRPPAPSSVAATASSAVPVASAAPPPEPPAPTNFWYTQTDTSPKDDSKSVWLTATSIDDVQDRFGQGKAAVLTIRCLEHKTSIMIEFGGQFMVSDIDNYGDVTYRIDTKKAQTRSMDASTDNSVLGLWSGGESIPFIKSLIGGKMLWVRAMPYNESAVDATFHISDLDVALKPLREACKW